MKLSTYPYGWGFDRSKVARSGKRMKRSIIMLLMAALLTAAGCAGDKGKDLYETAQFEEKQHNREHALQLYQEIVRKYPGSRYAEMAAKRIAEIGRTP
jgi:hypothetical protein